MARIQVHSHTADVRYTIEAQQLKELFKTALQCMNRLLHHTICHETELRELKISLETKAMDRSVLLIDFLSDVLTECHLQKAIFCDMTITQLDQNLIRADLYGTKIDQFEEDIKAVTYHEAEVHKNNHGNWQTNLIFDI